MLIVHNTCGSEAAQLWLTTDIRAGCPTCTGAGNIACLQTGGAGQTQQRQVSKVGLDPISWTGLRVL